uniref:Ig-like domain-containing protein n=1 Tax=Oreochromis aureus TaxID=47969 RepID=A0AAZ1XSZ7_OREAU
KKLLWQIYCSFCLCVFLCSFKHCDSQKARVKEELAINSTAGQNITLTCRAPNNNNNIIVVEWSRADLKEEYVLMYRDGHLYADGQHPSFKNRVDLQDRQMKDGDVSLILKDVTINDTGTYECRVLTPHTCFSPAGQTGGHTEDGGKEDGGKEDGGKEAGVSRGHFGLIAGLIFVAAVVGFLIYRAHQQQNQD